MADIEQLVLSISADTRQMQRALDRLESQSKQSTDRIANNFSKIDKSMQSVSNSVLAMGRNFVAGLAGAITFDAVLRGADQAIKAFDEIGDQATRIGFSTDALQALRFELEQNGGKAEDANRALDRFSDAVGEAAKGSGELHRWLKTNNVNIQEFLNLRPEQQLELVARMMAGLSREAQQLGFATDIFGRQAGPRFVGTLQRIASEGFPAVIQGAKDFGVVADKDLIEKAQKISDEMSKLQLQFQVTFGSVLINAIETGRTAFNDFIANVTRGIQILKDYQAGIREGPFIGPMPGATEFIGPNQPPRTPPGSTLTPDKDAEERARRGARTAETEAKRRQKTIDDLKHEAEQLGRTNREQFIYNELKTAGVSATSAQGQEIVRLSGQLYDAREAQKALNEAVQEFSGIAKSAISGFIKDMKNGASATEALSRALDRVSDRLIDVALNAVFSGLFPAAGAGGGGGIIGALFGGGKAGGGPVQAGHMYRVGERGTEGFIPNVSGRIVPNHQMDRGGGQALQLNYSPVIDARGADTTAVARLERIIAEDRRQFSSKVVATVTEARRRSVKV